MTARHPHIHLLVALLGMIMLGCGRSDRLVVYADPWLSPFTERALESFSEENPGMEIDLRVLSSEVIAQHLHYGQPVDVFLAFRPQIMGEKGLNGSVDEVYAFADVDLVQVETFPLNRRTELGGDSCWVVAASGRPLRILTEEWTALPTDSCILYADFCRQTQDYLLRGWANGGYVPGFFARKHPDRMRVVRQGPRIVGAFTAIQLVEAPHPAQAAEFMEFLRSEKCKSLLAEENYIP